MKYQSRADLLIAAGESIKMQEKAGKSIPVVKFEGHVYAISNLALDNRPEDYEFPLAVVEGKPVFVGDELYSLNLKTWLTVQNSYPNDKSTFNQNWIDSVSWNEPKPDTVMVELLRDDAEWMVRAYDGYNSKAGRIAEACSKALEKA